MEGLEELVAVVAREVAEEGEEAVVAEEGDVRERSLDLWATPHPNQARCQVQGGCIGG